MSQSTLVVKNLVIELDNKLVLSSSLRPGNYFNGFHQIAPLQEVNNLNSVIICRPLKETYEVIFTNSFSTLGNREEIFVSTCQCSDEDAVRYGLYLYRNFYDLSAIDIAEIYERVLAHHPKWSNRYLANILSCHPSQITNYLKLLDLIEDIKILVRNKKISYSKAKFLSRLKPSEQKKHISDALEASINSKLLGSKVKAQELNSQNFQTYREIQKLEMMLERKLSCQVKIKLNHNNAGDIQISFESIEKVKECLSLIYNDKNFIKIPWRGDLSFIVNDLSHLDCILSTFSRK